MPSKQLGKRNKLVRADSAALHSRLAPYSAYLVACLGRVRASLKPASEGLSAWATEKFFYDVVVWASIFTFGVEGDFIIEVSFNFF